MKFQVTITCDCEDPDLIKEVGKTAIKEEIIDGVQHWGGQRFPGDAEHEPDPLFNPYISVKCGPIKVLS